MEHIRRYDREELRTYYSSLPVTGAEVWANYAVNLWEYEHAVETLTSYPWNITIPMTEVCNAVCTFCSSPLVPHPKEITTEQIQHFSTALRYAVRVSLQGLGEPLAHPRFEAVVAEIKKYLNPVATLDLITNGWLLSEHRWELLKEIRISDLHVSVNAASDQTHQVAMGSKPGTFGRVVQHIEHVLADPDWPRNLKVSMVITRHSLPEVPKFLELFATRGVKRFQFNALLPLSAPDWGFGHTGQYLALWCGHLPDAPRLVEEAKAAIENYSLQGVQIAATPDQWLLPVDQRLPGSVSPPLTSDQAALVQISGLAEPCAEGSTVHRNGSEKHDRSPRNHPSKSARVYCPMVYNVLSVFHHSLDISVCCYMENASGHLRPNLTQRDLLASYNDSGFRLVRRTLNSDTHLPVCDLCPYGPLRS
jgi:hypothetical protein